MNNHHSLDYSAEVSKIRDDKNSNPLESSKFFNNLSIRKKRQAVLDLSLFIKNPDYNPSKGLTGTNSIEFIEIISDNKGHYKRLQDLIKKYEDVTRFDDHTSPKNTEASFSFEYIWWQGEEQDQDLKRDKLSAKINTYPNIFNVRIETSMVELASTNYELQKTNGIMYNEQDETFSFEKVTKDKLVDQSLTLENKELPVSLKTLSFKVVDNQFFETFKTKLNTKKKNYQKDSNNYFIIEGGEGLDLSFKLIQNLSQKDPFLLQIELLNDAKFHTKKPIIELTDKDAVGSILTEEDTIT